MTFTTNALGYGRVFMSMQAGGIVGYSDATHNETTLGVGVVYLFDDINITSGPSRIVAAGLWIRSLQAVLNDAGVMQTYASPLTSNIASYDVYRDSPN